MRSLLTIMLLAAAMLPALSQAQTVNICERTPQVRDTILQALHANDCAAACLLDNANRITLQAATNGDQL